MNPKELTKMPKRKKKTYILTRLDKLFMKNKITLQEIREWKEEIRQQQMKETLASVKEEIRYLLEKAESRLYCAACETFCDEEHIEKFRLIDPTALEAFVREKLE